jgi:hypothetical protein
MQNTHEKKNAGNTTASRTHCKRHPEVQTKTYPD